MTAAQPGGDQRFDAAASAAAAVKAADVVAVMRRALMGD